MSTGISVEKISTPMKLLVLKYCSKKLLPENALFSSTVLHFNDIKAFSPKLIVDS
jgi:hypothetical protein